MDISACDGAANNIDPTWVDHCLGLVIALTCIWAADVTIFCRLLPGAQSARWFMCHSAFNCVVVLTSFRDVFAVFMSPLCSLAVPMHSWTPAYITIAGHFYHAVGWTMKPHEIRHHVIFSGFGGIITLALRWGPLMNLALFFVSGLPGGIDYALLCAVKVGRMPRLREKQINTFINIWLRIPGLVTVGAFAWCCLLHGMSDRLPTAVLVVSILLSLANGLYYGEQVIGSYHRECALEKATMTAASVGSSHTQ